MRLSGRGVLYVSDRAAVEVRAEDRSEALRASVWWLSVVSGNVTHMTTTQNPIALTAEAILHHASSLVRDKWVTGTTQHRGYGIPEAIAQAAEETPSYLHHNVARVVAERQCQRNGLDVWWNDLVCSSGDEAAQALEGVAAIDPEQLYGPLWDANIGLLVLASTVTPDQLNALGNVMTHEAADAFIDCMELARHHDRLNMVTWLCEDIAFSVGHYATTPAGTYRRLKGIRAIECVGVHHVLRDLIDIDTAAVLVEPVARVLLPTRLDA